MATLLKKMAEERAAHEETLRLAVREALRRALHEVCRVLLSPCSAP